MDFSVETGISAFTVFVQGLLSFFSPCVLPLVPLYIGYLAGGTKTVDEQGVTHYRRSKVFINTLFFVLGVSFAFFLLGFGFSALGRFFSGNRVIFARIGGILVILFGLYQLGFFGSKLLGGRHQLPLRLDRLAMNPLVALLMGFTFSFAWTPCVGPALTSVLLMASSASSSTLGFLLIGLYTLGFVLPFLAVGLFTGSLLELFRKHRKAVQFTTKAGGVLLILMGIMMFTGWMNGITGYLSRFGAAPATDSSSSSQSSSDDSSSMASSEEETSSSSEDEKDPTVPAPDFTLTDQFGNEHTLSDYQGKVVFLNFMATWCGPCEMEIPDIQALYEDHGMNEEDLVVLALANPKTDEYPMNSDVSPEEVAEYLEGQGVTYPVLMDTTQEVFQTYGISAFPTTFMIDTDGNVYGYISGALTRSIMDDIVRQTQENT